MKDSAISDLLSAVRALHKGQGYFGPQAAKALAELSRNPGEVPSDPYGRLTPREREVFHLVVEGKTTKDVARSLEISVKTAENHRSRILEKLGCHNTAELVRYACAGPWRFGGRPSVDLRPRLAVMSEDLDIRPIPAFEDNYIWLVRSRGSDRAVVVDPGDEDPVLEALEREGLVLAGILVTHRHGDHTGGIGGLKAVFPGAPVFGPAGERIPTLTRRLGEGERVEIPGLNAVFEVMEVPGHTRGHIAYYGAGVLFCGDTLFAAGCGRVFDGTLEQLHASLLRIGRLPPETLVYCAHEYTLANLGFAQWVEPENRRLQARVRECRRRREAGQPTVPSSLAEELETNPFLRVADPRVRRAAEARAGRTLADGAEVFAAVRTWKDRDYD